MSLKKYAKFFKRSAHNKRIRFIEMEFQLLTNFREMLVVALFFALLEIRKYFILHAYTEGVKNL